MDHKPALSILKPDISDVDQSDLLDIGDIDQSDLPVSDTNQIRNLIGQCHQYSKFKSKNLIGQISSFKTDRDLQCTVAYHLLDHTHLLDNLHAALHSSLLHIKHGVAREMCVLYAVWHIIYAHMHTNTCSLYFCMHVAPVCVVAMLRVS